MNLFELPRLSGDKELVETIFSGKEVRMERIISTGQSSPDGFWYDQEQDEWVVVLQGKAVLSWQDGRSMEMKPGDWVMLPAHEKHRVEWTSANPPCIWLAVFGQLLKG